MKKNAIIALLAIVSILVSNLPKPINTVISLLILVPLIIYLIVHIVRYGNKW